MDVGIITVLYECPISYTIYNNIIIIIIYSQYNNIINIILNMGHNYIFENQQHLNYKVNVIYL